MKSVNVRSCDTKSNLKPFKFSLPVIISCFLYCSCPLSTPVSFASSLLYNCLTSPSLIRNVLNYFSLNILILHWWDHFWTVDIPSWLIWLTPGLGTFCLYLICFVHLGEYLPQDYKSTLKFLTLPWDAPSGSSVKTIQKQFYYSNITEVDP